MLCFHHVVHPLYFIPWSFLFCCLCLHLCSPSSSPPPLFHRTCFLALTSLTLYLPLSSTHIALLLWKSLVWTIIAQLIVEGEVQGSTCWSMQCIVIVLEHTSAHSFCGTTFSAKHRITHVELVAAALRGSRTLKSATLTCHFPSFSCRHIPTHTPKRQRLLSPLPSGNSFIILFNYSLCLLVKKLKIPLVCLLLHSTEWFLNIFTLIESGFNSSLFFLFCFLA